ncbi:UDP-N-acetylmuramoylalanyl-D-glutamate--2,6-diaminopimelate ligase [Oryzihumus leptocrescens]|uniref:UDP-N-acetylmuramoyl-L-alanyl-D-glutamate--2,6-diaminopimelate ligase n=1 Tax=Oryzihumus leptocrescens TaxID=297536 RepID=A0A542ZKJ6_9MICO|nr:UDP-N-acetylmuramoylalanyl-D-glutamate--2,6-diaminopimelate ligase [Oryzihumus leptocrescens]
MVSVAPRPQFPRATSLTEVAACAGAPATPGAADVEVTGVTHDSRAVRAGDLYAALPGANVHGAAFAAGAVDLGARAVLTDEAGAALVAASEVTGRVPVLVAADPRAVLGHVADLVHGHPSRSLTMLGVTGTNGKTTTAYLLDSALRALGRTTGLIGTVETRLGDERVKSVRTTPESSDLHALLAVMVERGVDTCTMEVSSHALTLHRVDGVVYDVAAFTNLSQDHLDFHGTMEEYFLAKASLFTPERSRRGVVCVDDAWGARLAREATVPVLTVGSDAAAGADFTLEPVEGDDAAFTLRSADVVLHLRSALPGDFNRVNTAVAAVVLLSSGLDAGTVEKALAADPHVPGRMERVVPESADPTTLPLAVVDFAHTPDAVAAALKSLRHNTSGRLVVVLGAGGDRDRAKRAPMGEAAADQADVVVVTDDNPRSEDPATIRAAVLEGARDRAARPGGATDVVEVAGRADAIRRAVSHATSPDDTVVVVGKGHETGQEVAGVVHPFDDREELRAALMTDQAPHGTVVP